MFGWLNKKKLEQVKQKNMFNSYCCLKKISV